MESKVTKHTSTNLEELNEKIARLLKDPSEAIVNASINVDAMTLQQLKEFAENGEFLLFHIFPPYIKHIERWFGSLCF